MEEDRYSHRSMRFIATLFCWRLHCYRLGYDKEYPLQHVHQRDRYRLHHSDSSFLRSRLGALAANLAISYAVDTRQVAP